MASVSESLECTVCIQTYNLTDRVPKLLTCHHTVCGQCIETLKKHNSLPCPTCRKESSVGQVTVNYTVRDVLQALCEECAGHQQKGKCGHCNKQLCSSCMEQHGELVYAELRQELSRMDERLRKAIDASKDTNTILDKEADKLETAKDRIKAGIQQRRDALDKLEEKLLTEVTKVHEDNVDRQTEWETSFDEKIGTVKTFYRGSKSKIGQKYSKEADIGTITQILEQCKDLVRELTEVQNNPPVLEDYTSSITSTDVNHAPISTTVMTRQDKPTDTSVIQHHDVPDYTTLKYKCTVGSKGSKPHQFNLPSSVICTSDQIIVSDEFNHRLKFYNNNLDLQSVVGEKGSGQGQFYHPSGLAVTQGGEVFVCDFNNHRIVVVSLQGEYIGSFGTSGASTNMFNQPQGMCIRNAIWGICTAYWFKGK